jgi:uncharacterized protein YutD
MKNIIIWLLGFYPERKTKKDQENQILLITNLNYLWEIRLFGPAEFLIKSDKAPIFFYRWMQSLILGFRFKRIY